MTSLLIAYLYGLLLLVIPGYTLGTTLPISKVWRLIFAPLLSAALISIIGEVAYRLGITLTTSRLVTLALLSSCMILVIYTAYLVHTSGESLKTVAKEVIQQICARNPKDAGSTPKTYSTLAPIDWRVALFAVAFAMFVGWFCYALPLGNPNKIVLQWDAIWHVTSPHTMIKTGIFSSFNTSMYLPSEATFAPYDISSRSLYPSIWHILAACISQGANTSIPVAMHALNLLCTTFIFPLGILGFMKCIIPNRRYIDLATATISPFFFSFVWFSFIYGPIVPFDFAQCMLPALCCSWFYLVKDWKAAPKVLLILLFILSSYTMAFTHTSGIFTAALILWPWTAWYIYNLNPQSILVHGKSISPKMLSIVFALVCLAIWVLLFLVIVQYGYLNGYYWPAGKTIYQTLRDALFLNFANGCIYIIPQPLLPALVAIGLYTAVKRTKTSFLLFPFFYFALTTVYIQLFDSYVKTLLSGFWYTDAARTSSCTCLIAIMLAAQGLDTIIDKVYIFVHTSKLTQKISRVKNLQLYCTVAVLALSILCVFFVHNPSPNYHKTEPFQYQETVKQYLAENNELSSNEIAFMLKVRDIIGTNVTILNNPYDGSNLGYALADLKVVYRHPLTYYHHEEKRTAYLRTNIVNWPKSAEVRKALKETGIRYVLKLEQPGKVSFANHVYTPQQFAGINSIKDTTPGFKCILAAEAMRLYEIDDSTPITQ